MKTTRTLSALLALSLAAFLPACGGSDGSDSAVQDGDESADAGLIESDAGQLDPELEKASGHLTVRSNKQRAAAPADDNALATDFARGQRELNAAIFAQMAEQFAGKNAMISSLSIQQALGMAWAGAKGETASQMATVLHFGENAHAAQNALSLLLKSREMPAFSNDYETFDAVELSIANALWTQRDVNWKSGFLDTLAEYYGAGVETMDFRNAPEPARNYINAWVAKETRDRIQDLIPEGSITPSTVSVLTNAVYFKSPWELEFRAENTKDADFTKVDGASVSVPFVQGADKFASFAEGEGWQAAQKTFRGGSLAMVFILPAAGTAIDAFASSLDADKFDGIIDALSRQEVVFKLPKFEFTTGMIVNDPLSSLGMTAAFKSDQADFSGMTEDFRLWIDQVIHKTFIALDEKGVEAAAATAVIMAGNSMEEPPAPKEFTADRPFIFAVRDVESGAILFYGQVMDPSKK